jgi:hypothetical protein
VLFRREFEHEYLRQLGEAGLVREQHRGKHVYFINEPLVQLLAKGEQA